jgi:hypothetical protein
LHVELLSPDHTVPWEEQDQSRGHMVSHKIVLGFIIEDVPYPSWCSLGPFFECILMNSLIYWWRHKRGIIGSHRHQNIMYKYNTIIHGVGYVW